MPLGVREVGERARKKKRKNTGARRDAAHLGHARGGGGGGGDARPSPPVALTPLFPCSHRHPAVPACIAFSIYSLASEHPHEGDKVDREYTNVRNKPFPWGDKPLFYAGDKHH